MIPEEFHQVRETFESAMQLPAESRKAYIQSVCADDTELLTEVERMVEAAEYSKCPRDRPTVEIAAETATATGRAVRWQPTQIGRYRILGVLGEGGMGVVYEAEQDQPRRRVALKVIKPGLANPELLRRFELESQALGRLQHPGIAQIYEAGTADGGLGPQPFFAMEFIQGQSLLKYAEAHQLNTRQRLEFMAKVCEAVHHAHQRGIIHRDLKPGNILVEESGQPKVLDFGVARVTDSDAQATRQTDVGQIVGTLAYMSPEQVLGDALELDTRSDVYALGVILFELLAGRLPYAISDQLHAAVQTIREADPARLSSVSRTYRGDIETIVGKALEKDKGRRYASAAGMAADIQRYLRDEPIAARPPSTTYQLRKFARRHKALVAGVAAVLIVLLGGIIAATWEAKRAEAEAATARAVNDFLQNDLLAQASAYNQARPDTKPDPELKVRTALDRAAARISGKFDRRPLVEASIRQTIGKAYIDLGLYPDAQRQLQGAVDLRLRALGKGNRDTLESMDSLATLYDLQGKFAQAEPLYINVLEARRRVLGERHPDTLITMEGLAGIYDDEGKYPQAEELFTRVLETRREVLGEQHQNTLATMNDLALVCEKEGKYAQAEHLYIQVIENTRRVLGPEHPDTLASMNNLAILYRDEGNYGKAAPLDTKTLEIERRVLGEEHPETLATMNNLAQICRLQGKYGQAEPLFIKVVEIARRVLGDQHPNTLASMYSLGVLYRDEGKYEQADSLLLKVLRGERRVLGERHPQTQRTINNLAASYLSQHKYAAAEQLLRPALQGYETVTHSWSKYVCQRMLGASLAGQRRYSDAEPLLLSAYEGMIRLPKGSIPADSQSGMEQAGNSIIQLYQDWGKLDKAAEWRRKLQGATTSARTN